MFKRRVAVFLAAILVFAILAVCLCACDNGSASSSEEKSVLVFVGDKAIETTTSKTNLHALLLDLKAEGKLDVYTYADGGYGAYITAIENLQQDFSAGKYYSVWHSLGKDELKGVHSAYDPSRGIAIREGLGDNEAVFVCTIHKERMLYYSAVGVSEIPIEDGAVYAILVD